MSAVFRRSRRRNGVKVKSLKYYTRIGRKSVNLGVTDKQVAEQKAAALVREVEREGVGLILPKPMRLAASRPLTEHVEEYIKDLTVLGRSEKHINLVESRVRRLLTECGWSVLGEITADSFQTWRAKQKAAPKTINEYLNAIRAFCNWMVDQNRMTLNPLMRIVRVETRGMQVERRALTVEEVSGLLSISGSRSLFYLVAVQTGLRRGEIEGLKWGDIDFDTIAPCIRVRASTTKNHKSAVIPLHDQLTAALSAFQPSFVDAGELVFPGGLPRMRAMRMDYNAAGIAAQDTQGRLVDFHCLRKTFDTRLQVNGAGLTTVMNLMRHSGPNLTAITYTDASLLPQAQAINALPWYGKKKGTEKGTTSIVKTGSEGSATVHNTKTQDQHETPANIDQSRDLSQRVRRGLKRKMVGAAGFEPATFWSRI
ncbi:MAG: site-specific integrase [bacterium]